MTNPDTLFYTMHWKRTLTMRLSCFAFGLVAFFLTTTVNAQNNVADDWTPGQNILPTVQSDPHDQVKKLLRQEKFERAEVLVDKFMAVNPRDPQMRFWKAWITDRTGDKQVALDLYLSLTQDYPEIAEPFNNLAVLYAAKGQFSVAKEAALTEQWVNLSKRGGMDGVFRGLAGLLRGISRGQSPREIPRSSPASPRKTPSFPTLLLRFTFYF